MNDFMFGAYQPLPGRHPARMYARDSLRNFVTGLGTLKDPRVSSNWYLNVLDRNVLETAYRSDWLARRLVDLPAYDSTREWRTWQASQKQIQSLDRLEKRLFFRHKTMEAIQRARLYGGAALLLGVDVGEPEDELDPDDVGKDDLQWVVVLNRYELSAGPRIYNVASPYYTRPEYYTVSTPMFGFYGESGEAFPTNAGQQNLVQPPRMPQGRAPLLPDVNRQVTPAYGMIRIHPSRVIEFAGNPLPDWRLAPMGGGWGDSVLQTIDDSLRDFAMIMGGLASVVNDMKLDVVSVPELSRHLSTDDMTQKFLARWQLANQAKSTINTLLIDESEKWERITTSFGSTPELIRVAMQVSCAAGGVPMSRIMGQAPNKGLGTEAGNETDLRYYYDDLQSLQHSDYRRIMYVMDRVIVASATGDNDQDIDYEWNPLFKENPAEQAQVALQKAQTTQIYVNLGLINEDALREGVVSQLTEDKTYPALETAIDEFGAEPEEPPAPPPPAMLPTPPPGMLNKGQFDPNPFHMLRAQAASKAGQPIRVPPNPPRRPGIPAPQQQQAKDYDPDEPRDPAGKWTAGQGMRPEAIASRMNAEGRDVAHDVTSMPYGPGVEHTLYSRSGDPEVEQELERHLGEAGHKVDVYPQSDLEWLDEPEGVASEATPELSVPIAPPNKYVVRTKDAELDDFNPNHDKLGRFTSAQGTESAKAAAKKAAATSAKRSASAKAAHERRRAHEAQAFPLPDHPTAHQAGMTAVSRVLAQAQTAKTPLTTGEVAAAAKSDIKRAVEAFEATRHLKEPVLPPGVSRDRLRTAYRMVIAATRYVRDPASAKILVAAVTKNSMTWREAAAAFPPHALTVAHHAFISKAADTIGDIVIGAVVGAAVSAVAGPVAGGAAGVVATAVVKAEVEIGLEKLSEKTGFTPEHIKHLLGGVGAALHAHYQKWKQEFGHLTGQVIGRPPYMPDVSVLTASWRRVRPPRRAHDAAVDEFDPIEQALLAFDDAVASWNPSSN
jgi:hypothetical protein